MKTKRFFVVVGDQSEITAKIISDKYTIGLEDYFTDPYTGERVFDEDLVPKAQKWILSQTEKWAIHPGPHEMALYITNENCSDFINEVVEKITSKGYAVYKLKTERIK